MRASSLLVVLLFASGAAVADDKALDVTIKVVETPADLPGAVTKTIQLPPAALKMRDNAAPGDTGSGRNLDQSDNRGKGSVDNVVKENAPGKGKDKNNQNGGGSNKGKGKAKGKNK